MKKAWTRRMIRLMRGEKVGTRREIATGLVAPLSELREGGNEVPVLKGRRRRYGRRSKEKAREAGGSGAGERTAEDSARNG